MNVTDYFQKLYSLFAYQDLLSIALSIVVGLIIGAEREYKSKTAGLRTLMLVSVGSCTFTILSIRIGVANPDRLAANIITGIGFLGAGAIFKDENKINGITTACTIWVTAALGMCIGSGHIYLGLLATLVVIFVLWNVVVLERWIDRTHKVKTYRITTDYSADTIARFEKIFSGFHLRHLCGLKTKTEGRLTVSWQITGNEAHHEQLTTYLLNDPAVLRLEV
jgi:putative Mg2+ transporter-C (MgtC) family protein